VSTGSGVQYAYSSWSDAGAQSHTITIDGSANYTATFVTFIPLAYNYVPGEQMIYDMSANYTNTAAAPPAQNWSETGTMTMDIISFDGENYTINEETTTFLSSLLSTNSTSSTTFTMNKTGYVTTVKSTAAVQELTSWYGNLIPAFEKNETEAGENWQIPLNALTTNVSSVYLNGTLTETFGDIQNITVPAGTYRAFNVDVSANNITMITNYPFINTSTIENFTIQGQVYMEYGTCRMIEMNLQESYSVSQNGQASNASTSEEMELVKYISS
jgi:hypothetical protein